jgi:hypothetical protein
MEAFTKLAGRRDQLRDDIGEAGRMLVQQTGLDA